MSNKLTATLDKEKRGGKNRPVIHVLMPDGRVTEFKDRGIVLMDSDNAAAGGVRALLLDSENQPCVTADGELAIVAVPVMTVAMLADPDKLLSWKQMAKRAGVSKSTVKRMVAAGDLPKPQPIVEGGRLVGLPQGKFDAALVALRGAKRS